MQRLTVEYLSQEMSSHNENYALEGIIDQVAGNKNIGFPQMQSRAAFNGRWLHYYSTRQADNSWHVYGETLKSSALSRFIFQSTGAVWMRLEAD
jgi:hypothetical protein